MKHSLVSTTIDENARKEKVVNPTFPSNQGVKLSLAGMEFMISNEIRDGETLIQIRVKNESISTKDSSARRKNIKSNKITRNKTDNIEVNSSNGTTGVSSMRFSNDFASQPDSLEIRNGANNELSTSQNRKCQKNRLQQHQTIHNPKDVDVGTSSNQIDTTEAKSQKRTLPMEEAESSKSCKVCGDESSKFIHYGGRCCQSCRAFFRRTVEKQRL